MRILVAYATRHGATRGIAERIAETLQGRELQVDLRPARDVGHPSDYDAFVIGSAAYMFHWLDDAVTFVRHHRFLLAERPVWLFSSGPIGTEEVDAQGRDVRKVSEPKEFPEFREAIHPRGEHIFFGAYDPGAPPIGLAERLTRMMPAARDALPSGDFRDWAEIEAWAGSIADELAGVPSEAVPAGAR